MWGEKKNIITNINWSVCMFYDVEESDMSTDIVQTELGAYVCLCVEGFLKHHIHQKMFLSVCFTKTEEVVHDLTKPAPCRFVAPKNRLLTASKFT